MGTETQPPAGEPALRTLAMPADANPNGDIFGGWVMSQMDLAGSVPAVERAGGRVATVAVDAMRFHEPVYIGDLVSCYAEIMTVGTTSIGVRVETWARRRHNGAQVRVTEGTLIYVALDDSGRPRAVSKVEDKKG
jgi:acyl-CoA thioesterase YciA